MTLASNGAVSTIGSAEEISSQTGIWYGIGWPWPTGSNSGTATDSITDSITGDSIIGSITGSITGDGASAVLIGTSAGQPVGSDICDASGHASSTHCSMTGPTDSPSGATAAAGSAGPRVTGSGVCRTAGSGARYAAVCAPAPGAVTAPPKGRADFPEGNSLRRKEGSDAFNCRETCRGPPFKTLAAIARFTVGVMVTGATLGPVTDAVCLKAGIWIMPRW